MVILNKKAFVYVLRTTVKNATWRIHGNVISVNRDILIVMENALVLFKIVINVQ